ncbi:MAG: hypothetical protein KBG15_17975 [Kofleriaceae bacterium]|nr:hypothetical protein [Kofleriaceae bacterium]
MRVLRTLPAVICVVIALATSAGCAQILGLDKTTKADEPDAAVVPGLCDVPLACAVDGSELCGQLVAVGATTARVADPIGAVCIPNGEGPCAVTVTVATKTNLFGMFDPTLTVAAIVDDCGRFKAGPLPADGFGMNGDLAVMVEGGTTVRTATLVRNRTATGGVLTTVRAPMVPLTSVQAWVAAINIPTPTSAYLVQYPMVTSDRSNWSVRLDGVVPTPQPVAPFAYYFAGDEPFAVLDTALPRTGPSGTAIVVSNQPTFRIGGDVDAMMCSEVTDLQLVSGTLLFLDLSGC